MKRPLFIFVGDVPCTLTAHTGATAVAPTKIVWIPSGEFTMGSDSPGTRRNEQPTHKVSVNGFWLDANDVTNAEFRKFEAAAKR